MAGVPGSSAGAHPRWGERGLSCFPATVPVSSARASLRSMQGEAAVGGGSHFSDRCQWEGRPSTSHSTVSCLGAARSARGMECPELLKAPLTAVQNVPGHFGAPVLSPEWQAL